jgi:hypothetical protein
VVNVGILVRTAGAAFPAGSLAALRFIMPAAQPGHGQIVTVSLHVVGDSGHFVGVTCCGHTVSMMRHRVSPPGQNVSTCGHVVRVGGHCVSPPAQTV